MSGKWKYHTQHSMDIVEIAKHKDRGRPKSNAQPDHYSYKVALSFTTDEAIISRKIHEKSCFILGTNRLVLNPVEILSTYKQQGYVERGFRFLKDPI
ncbi:MAG: hypothetical protein KA436_12650, partial [Oligoflexales bacterium]|nr:hypothetical protein [Oligoflexales bacterium]